MTLTSVLLDQGWTLTLGSGPVPDSVREAGPVSAIVPGCVHTDLLRAGLIQDPYLDLNEADVSWIGRTEAAYSCRIEVEPPAAGEHLELVFDGIDTVARVALDGVSVAEVENQHRCHRIDVTSHLQTGRATLEVSFPGQLDEAERRSDALGPRPHVMAYPFNSLRKMACNFGWDWGPHLVTAGLWRPVRLERWEKARLRDVMVTGTLSDTGTAVLSVKGVVDNDTNDPLTVRVTVGSQSWDLPATGEFNHALDVKDVELWWPRGYGSQPLYPVTVELLEAGERRDIQTRTTGFRSVGVNTEDGAFTLVVNGRSVYIKGANWIPDDCFPSRVDRSRYRRSINRAVECGVNLLRVWGGGIYEDHAFFEICDELGILTWQDFLLACATYSEDEPLRGEILSEAEENVRRLAHHPSLVLWNGNNENLWAYEDWGGWPAQLEGKTWGEAYYRELLPEVVRRVDPSRPYTPGSPFSEPAGMLANDPDHQTMHIWDVWNELDYTHYRDHRPRFVAEFGYQGPPTWATLKESLHDEPLSPRSAGMVAHQKADDGNDKLDRGIVGHLPVPADFELWHWAMQLQQARAVHFGLTYFRSLAPHNSGAIVWQHNDCWPVTSWAAVDGYGRRKPLWYALQDAYRPRLLTIQPDGEGLQVVAHNDTDQSWQVSVRVARRDLGGADLAEQSANITVGPRSTAAVAVADGIAAAADPRREFVHATAGGEAAFWYFVEDVDLELADDITSTAVRDGEQVLVTVTSNTLTKDVTILADKVAPQAVVDRGLVTLAPHESTTFRISGVPTEKTDDLLSSTVLVSANRLITGSHS